VQALRDALRKADNGDSASIMRRVGQNQIARAMDGIEGEDRQAAILFAAVGAPRNEGSLAGHSVSEVGKDSEDSPIYSHNVGKPERFSLATSRQRNQWRVYRIISTNRTQALNIATSMERITPAANAVMVPGNTPQSAKPDHIPGTVATWNSTALRVACVAR
jgi:hypothetical protein